MKRILLLVLSFTYFLTLSISAKPRQIRNVEPVKVSVAVGSVPVLPWQVWVNYSDGVGEWRQTRWTNSLRKTEEEQADPALHPVGSEYTIEGFVIGDNTTDLGYPIEARVKVVETLDDVPDVKPKAEPLPLADVQLTGKNRLTHNRDLLIREVLSWDADQQLYNYRDTYGLSTLGWPQADGWDSPTTKLKGHGSGHYMSALAFAFASAQDEETRSALRQRITHMVDELRRIQERTFLWVDTLGRYWEARDLAPESELRYMKGTWEAFDEYKKDWEHYGYGYLNAIPAQHAVLIEMYRPYNNEEWVWAPYYSIHKQLAGLIDIALNIDDKAVAQKALLIAKDMGLWVWNRLHYRTFVDSEGSREQRRQRPGNRYEMWNMYIAGEVGGMAESLSRLSEMVTDADEKARLLEAAGYFDAPAFFQPLSRNIDDIRTRHANQHIPMITGALRSYRGNENPFYYRLAMNFWNLVQGRYAYAMGGVGNGEMFRQPYSQMLSMNTNVMTDYRRNIHPNPDINETCCAYNLAKLTKDLNTFTPDDARLMDYYERLLYNQIIGSINPEHYGVTYQYAVGLDARKPFGNETPQSTCCGGTGAENHTRYQEAAYFVNDQTLWVALYLPTQVVWRAQGVMFRQECEWPAQQSRIVIEQGGRFAMRLRVPYWATKDFDICLNGRSVAKHFRPCSYVEIPLRQWKQSDVVEIVMPFGKHVNYGPDKMDLATTAQGQVHFQPQWVGALMLGPLVMASADVHNWSQAEFNLQTDLSDVAVDAPASDDGTGSPLYALSIGASRFLPDYYHTGRATHYLRLNQGEIKRKLKNAQGEWATLLQQAREREADRQAWAPHGYRRMLEAMQSQDTAALKTALATMRPSNLAEPEDLSELLPLLTQAKNVRDKSTSLREAIDYADMVVQYVNDGSGTRDLITKAMQQLRKAQGLP